MFFTILIMSPPNEEWQKKYNHVAIPISNLTIEAIGGTARDKGKNIYALGLICRIFNLNSDKLKGLINEKFKGKNPAITETALNAFNAGHLYELGDLIETFSFSEATHRDSSQVVMNGNEALAYGLIAAGVRFGAGYPITPWSDIMELLRRELPKYGGSFIQCEDEIASIAMALGASYRRPSGSDWFQAALEFHSRQKPWAGASWQRYHWCLLMCNEEALQRGMPTNVEQSDLNIACFGGHGDSPRVVSGSC